MFQTVEVIQFWLRITIFCKVPKILAKYEEMLKIIIVWCFQICSLVMRADAILASSVHSKLDMQLLETRNTFTFCKNAWHTFNYEQRTKITMCQCWNSCHHGDTQIQMIKLAFCSDNSYFLVIKLIKCRNQESRSS